MIIKALRNKKKRKSPENEGSEEIPHKVSKSETERDTTDEMIALSDMLSQSDTAKFETEK